MLHVLGSAVGTNALRRQLGRGWIGDPEPVYACLDNRVRRRIPFVTRAAELGLGPLPLPAAPGSS
jgi:hypothetical protein